MGDSSSQKSISQRRECFARLGLESTATVDEVTSAYRKLAAQQHPDTGGATEAFHALERAYRECLALVQERPTISGRPSRDNFSLRLPSQMTRRVVGLAVVLATVAVLALLLGWSQAGGAIALGIVVPLAIGVLIGNLSPGKGLLLSGVALLTLGLGWLAATYHIGWISYAFTSVPGASRGSDYVAAVDSEKQFWLILAIASTALTVFSVVIGCLVSLTRRF